MSEIVGTPGLVLLGKIVADVGDWTKYVYALPVDGLGCVLYMSTKSTSGWSETSVWVPGAVIHADGDYGRLDWCHTCRQIP